MTVSHEAAINAERTCPCGKELCRPGQRNGPLCAAKANREYRKRQADKRAAEQRLALAGIAARAHQPTRGNQDASR